MKKLIIFTFLSCSIIFSQEKTYTESNAEITATLGENFNITLASNHTTGYSWSVGMVSDNSQVVITGMDYDVAPDVKTGEGGEEVWHLKAVAPGTAKVIFYYARAWENDKPIKEVTFNVNVK
ncbi:MAG: protease inhibitor I42 family protein [Chlorobi bacterium]|nr:protease inhibitor I42 family protein [Chlorobiota bacterium]MCI0714876.1 protease inhibitor I42 family protein [Chlorobiota bacterium]